MDNLGAVYLDIAPDRRNSKPVSDGRREHREPCSFGLGVGCMVSQALVCRLSA